jgi:short-subunit dehydrogenase involved in D-alanine esterification of teichoic acids
LKRRRKQKEELNEVLIYKSNVSNIEDVKSFYNFVKDKFKEIYVLIYNAGIQKEIYPKKD